MDPERKYCRAGKHAFICNHLYPKTAVIGRPKTHGHNANGRISPEYNSWRSAKQRVMNPNRPEWSYYGGRGIHMCQEWLDSFTAFFEHMGPRPGPKWSLDRIDNDGHYEPGNVRWATASQQARNRPTARRWVRSR